ncbi:MAG: DUF2141 domain-containing protein [Candidatus Thiodiazotropha taylori]|uniref:DUF2141 domain-containing protein n=1 Tax=Candidatus Thiodiazotropha taylori TaxID=2792791 RepID=A0A9E4K8U6_9GAMM|nr:DUF2141 domain-containing protein [Candidatus Thiodiazotropha taylori]MCW4255107.1 DUF2141 domain-containing protein [Candidatus Thiodiazotropha taylori]
MHKFITTAVLTLAASAAVAGTLEVTVQNIEKDGIMHIGVYENETVFENDRARPQDKPAKYGVIEEVKVNDEGTATFTVKVPDGVYAVGIYNDENRNEKLDTNFFGIPKEQYGFSNNPKVLGIPKFEQSAFEVKGDTKTTVVLK